MFEVRGATRVLKVSRKQTPFLNVNIALSRGSGVNSMPSIINQYNQQGMIFCMRREVLEIK